MRACGWRERATQRERYRMTSAAATAPPAWGQLRKGRRNKPPRVFFYSVEKFGKTGFGVGAKDAIILDFEDSTAEYENAESFDMRGTSAEGIIQTLDLVKSAPNGKQTVVIDTADAMERTIQKAIMRESNCESIEEVDGGYGKGYVRTSEAFASIFRKLDELREDGFTVIVLAHAAAVNF